MKIKLPWLVVHRIKKLHRYVAKSNKLADKINMYLYGICCACDDTSIYEKGGYI